MTARSRMTQRALVQRYTPGSLDDSLNPSPGSWATVIAAMPCWLEASTEREVTSEATELVVSDLRLLAPLHADVTESDRISGIVDRRGTSILAGLLDVNTVLRKRSHLLLTLTRVAA